METGIAEIAAGIYRLSTFVPEVEPPAGLTFNQFLVLGGEPLLFHTGLRRMFPLVRGAVARVITPERLRWIGFGHYEADESGMAPRAERGVQKTNHANDGGSPAASARRGIGRRSGVGDRRPPMPVELYRRISDRDLAAVVAWLRAVPLVRHAVTERSAYPSPLEPYGPPVGTVPDPPADDPLARGAYLAGPLAHCTACHTPPLPGERSDWSRTGAGGLEFNGPWGAAVAPNITPHPERGLGDWTEEEVVHAITRGVSRDGRRLAPPMGARAPVFARLAERDLRDIVAYLRSLPPQP